MSIEEIRREIEALEATDREHLTPQGVSFLAGLRRTLEWIRDGRKGPLWDHRTFCGW